VTKCLLSLPASFSSPLVFCPSSATAGANAGGIRISQTNVVVTDYNAKRVGRAENFHSLFSPPPSFPLSLTEFFPRQVSPPAHSHKSPDGGHTINSAISATNDDDHVRLHVWMTWLVPPMRSSSMCCSRRKTSPTNRDREQNSWLKTTEKRHICSLTENKRQRERERGDRYKKRKKRERRMREENRERESKREGNSCSDVFR
jgi:hypothetical protein